MEHGSTIRSKFTVTHCDVIAVTVPIEPFTKPFLVSMFLHNITLAPIAMVRSASSPAVRLQSLFNYLS